MLTLTSICLWANAGLKVLLASVLSSTITALSRCSQISLEDSRADSAYDWSSSLSCATSHGYANMRYNLVHGASLLQFFALYGALHLVVERRRNLKFYVHIVLCAIWTVAPLKFGHHLSLPQSFRQTQAYHHFTYYAEVPALFFAFAAFQLETAYGSTGAYGGLLYWSLPQLCIVACKCFVLLFDHARLIWLELAIVLWLPCRFVLCLPWRLMGALHDAGCAVLRLLEWGVDTVSVFHANEPGMDFGITMGFGMYKVMGTPAVAYTAGAYDSSMTAYESSMRAYEASTAARVRSIQTRYRPFSHKPSAVRSITARTITSSSSSRVAPMLPQYWSTRA